MTGSRVALVADDPRVAGILQAALATATHQPVFPCKYNTIRTHLGRDTDGVLVLAVAAPADADLAFRLTQEIVLQKLPPTVVLLLAEGCPPPPEFAALRPHIRGVLRWPDNEGVLADLIVDGARHAETFLGTREETLEEIIRRRLLCMTPSLTPMVDRIALAAAHDVTVLLTGETGTGKTYLAKLMHDCSPRKAHPFLPVPCGAQPANLVESAFFGHVKGAFTGADRQKIGKFEAAGSGTILLDEIDTLGLEQQAGLLRVIETGEYEPVGSNETKTCTARIIVASNWDLEEAATNGQFRQDLYYRLNVMSFHLPALRERPRDIESLARGMAARFTTKFRKDLFDISAEALHCLETFPWPGNIRQMENAVQQAVLVSSGPILLPQHLPQSIRDHAPPARNTNGHVAVDEELKENINAVERGFIEKALERHGHSRAKAAAALGISRVTLYKKMKKYGLMELTPRGAGDEG